MSKKIKQMKGRQAHYTRSLKPCCHGDQPTRSPDTSSVPTQETSRTAIGGRRAGQRFLVRRSSVLVQRLINVRSVFFCGSVPVIAAVHQRRTLDLESCSSSHSCLLVVDGVVFVGLFFSSAVGLPAKCFLNTCRELHFRNMDTVLRDQKQRGGRRSGAGWPVKSWRTNRTPRGKENVQSRGAATSPKAVASRRGPRRRVWRNSAKADR